MATSLWAMALAVLVTIIGTFGALFVKLGSRTFSFNPMAIIKNYKLIIGIALYGIANILFILALKGGDLSVMFPLLALGYIWIIPVSIKFLGEKITTSKLAGIAFILVGVSLIGIS
jgi:multidrug transporter EmrE-like cation transporter|tara:strand:- start:1550 stop:1897 length:348 start_codon:yes stop_codon:yes gene_type:complete